MEENKINVRVDKKIHAKVVKYTRKSKHSIGGFYDLAAKEKLEKESELIKLDNNSQHDSR
jgi:predicted HicB family RNase H-like nuclease